MDTFRLPFGEWVEAIVDFIGVVFGWLFDAISVVLGVVYEALDWVLITPPFWVIILVFAALAWWIKGWKLAVGTALGLLFIVLVDQWDNAMDTLALVLVASAIAVIISVPTGIWAARNDTVSRLVRPVLDFLQTMPAFVYLIPAIIFFGVGVVPGMIATILFALAPGVRLTELGIRGVDAEVVEAGQAFGATRGRILRQIQLPLALPSIMAGVNQVIMLSLSMVVIAGIVGAGGLGGEITRAIGRINVGLGFEAGVAIVILAMMLDRMTSALADKGGARAKRRKKTSPDNSTKDTQASAETAQPAGAQA
ncbi:MAG: glycine/betaine ABC transporter permease [Microbacterium sp.]|jgi:ABC-type proline/glycine betaine transport system permease subunit|uniref:ABC transporter permease n=1 Tax=unclassified Microbacterium TaxID=2609290 RepID=UPI0008D91E82|nr:MULTISPECIES: proline/glycine betaine ABC transporter permease [unclassified Microbacterium]MAY49788.1 glycine/betaine ABC transporter permease [Microbacterium sp.]HBR89681.1 proline/glycine betaine ABC transporter permease [Microbacterium sp.]HBS75384.1 proline/glycine betaine ABC transporter permease [Microbacterium sp.]|tara:strand:- start:5544 stop:6470 length:927 start_codon:yes stop_codon:yes gene_type:complete